jgi:hypothetical protein
MAKTKIVVKEPYSANARVFEAKKQRRIEKANYAPARKLETVTKLRDTARSLRSAKLVKKGKVVCD